MSRISEQTIEQIRSTADIVEVISGYIELKKRGRNHFGLCPFHGEKTASFSVNAEKQIYKCFGCNVGGGVINFIMEIEGLEFVNALKHLADQYGIQLDIDNSNKNNDITSNLFSIHDDAANIFLDNLLFLDHQDTQNQHQVFSLPLIFYHLPHTPILILIYHVLLLHKY